MIYWKSNIIDNKVSIMFEEVRRIIMPKMFRQLYP